MNRNEAGQEIFGQLVDATTGGAWVGTATVYVTIDNGLQNVGAGTATAMGHGQFRYSPTQAETDGALIAYLFTGTGAVAQTVNVPTITAAQLAAIQLASGSGSTTSVLALITQSLRRIGVIAEGAIPGSDQAIDAMAILNDYVADVLTNDRLAIFSITRTTFSMTNGTADYTVGIGGTINIPRPVTMNMQGCNVQFIDTSSSQPNTEISLWPLTDDTYQAIAQKGVSGTYPTSWYFNPTFTPYATLTFWPVPNVSTLVGVLYSPAAVQEFSALTQIIALPPGYRRFLRDNLAVELATEYTIVPSQTLLTSARESKAGVLATNTRIQDLGVDLALVPMRWKSNIYLGP